MTRSFSVFGAKYSGYYDQLYHDKDYGRECDYLEVLFRNYFPGRITRVRDVACGTGGHALPLAQRRYHVYATDISEHMVSVARDKAEASHLRRWIHLGVGDMRHVKGTERFEACLCMFASIGYLPSAADVVLALKSMRKCLTANGILVLDFWNGLAVLTVGPSQKYKRIRRNGFTIARKATPKLDPVRSLCTVKYDISVTKPSGGLIDHFRETHTMRFFYPEEIRELLASSHLDLVSLHPFLNPKGRVSVSNWNITAVARRVD